MIKKLIKNSKLAGLIFALMLNGTVNIKCDSGEDNPLISGISHSSNSSKNSVNKVFVTGEEIDVSARLNENADRVDLEEERQSRDATITNSYEMSKIGDNEYFIRLNKFEDASIFCFRIKISRNGIVDYSGKTCEPILVSEEDSRNIIKNWLDNRNTELIQNAAYTEKERISYPTFSIEADFNLKKAEGFVLNYDAIIEYAGENDGYTNFRFEEEDLNELGITNIYIKPFFRQFEGFPVPDDLTTRQDLENLVSGFYYSL